MPELYTPFIRESVQNLSNAFMRRDDRAQQSQERQLFGDAYMGDPNAQARLAQVRPDLAMKLDQMNQQREQNQLAQQSEQAERERGIQLERQEALTGIMETAGKMGSFEEARQYADQAAAQYGGALGEIAPFTEEAYEAAKNAFGGTSTDALNLEKLELEVQQARKNLNDNGTSAKELLEVENLLSQIRKREQDLASSIEKDKEKQKDIEAKEAAETSEAQSAIKDIDGLLTSDLDKIYGAGEAFYPDKLLGQESKDMVAVRDRIGGLLQLAAAGKLKGQGQVSEGERQILREAASILTNETISPAQAKKELQRARKTFSDTLTRKGKEVPSSGKDTQSRKKLVNDLVSKYGQS